ncbi:MAG: nicotinate-nucleotide adenylyltransferase [Candidatus Omnitrophota bacterium]
MRIGILGGTFNPIHFGHLNLADESRRVLKLDKVIFVPAKTPPHKKNIIVAAKHRFKMVELAIKNIKWCEISAVELERRGKSYSVETIKIFRQIYSKEKLYFITGADSIKELNTWKEISKIFKLCKFVVATRPGFIIKNIPKYIKVIKIKPLDIAAKDIRKLLRQKKSVSNYVPENVRRYITMKQLYRNNRV